MVSGTIGVTVSLGSSQINSNTSYSFTLNLESVIGDTSSIFFIFPASSGVTLPSVGTVSCSGLTGFKKTPVCTVQSTTTIKVTFASNTIDKTTFPLYVLTVFTSYLSQLQINNILNPPSAVTISTLQIQTFNSTTQLDSTSSGIIAYQPITVSSSKGSLATGDPTVGNYAAFTVRLTTSTLVPQNGKVVITFPKWEDRTLGQSTPQSMVDRVLTCTSSLGSPTCSATISSTSTGTTDTVTVNGLFSSSSFSAGGLIDITINQVRNPPTLKTYSSFIIQTADSSGNAIEKCSGLSLSLTTTGTLSSQSVIRLTGNTIVNQQGTYLFILTVTNPIPVGGWIRVILPSQVSTTSVTYSSLVPALSSSATVTLNSQTIEIKSGISTYITEGSSVSFTLGNIKNPTSTTATSSFQVYTFDESNFGIDKKTTGLTVSATVGALTNVKIKPVNITGVLQYALNYSVAFTIANPLDTTGSITLKFDSSSFGFVVGTRTCNVSGLNTGYTCKADSSANTIVISSFLDSAVVKGKSFAFTIGNLYVRNPPTSRAAPAYQIYTSQSGNQVDSDTSVVLEPDEVDIPTFSVSAGSYVTNKENVTYIFTVVPPGYIIQTTYMVLTLPAEMSIFDYRLTENNCGKNTLVGFTNNTKLDCSVSGKTITIKKGFTKQITDDPPTLKFSISSLRNPRTMEETSNFTLYFYDGSDKYPTFIKVNDSSIQMTSSSTIKTINMSRTSTTNGDTSDYTINFSLSNQIVNNDYIVITSPTTNGATFPSTTQCFGTSSNFISTNVNLNCTVTDSSNIKIPIKLKSLRRQLQSSTGVSISSSIQLLIKNVKNPISTQPTSSFKITQYSSNGYAVESVSSGVTITNTAPGELKPSQFSVTPTTYQVGETTSYSITFDPQNYQQDMWVQIIVPEEVTMPSESKDVSCTALYGIQLDFTCQYNTTTRALKLINGFPYASEPKKISFQFSPVKNPDTIMRTQSFKIYTYTSDNYALDAKDTFLYLDFACSLPCKTCVSNNILGCSSCYNPNTNDQYITELPFLYSQYCYDSCPTSTYTDYSNYKCINCYSKLCKSCSGSKHRQCTSCVDGAALINGNCVHYEDASYFMPFFILSILWMITVFIVMVASQEGQTWFVASSIFGISFCEWILMFVELGVFDYFGFIQNTIIVAICGVIANCLINIGFMIFYLKVLRNEGFVREHRQNHKRIHISAIIVSFTITNRFFKLLYSHFADKEELMLTQIFKAPRLKKQYLILNCVSLIPTFLLLINAIYNLALSVPYNLKTTILIDVERILISLILMTLMIIEFIPKCQERRQFLQKIMNKKMRAINVAEKYNEVANSSMLTIYDQESDNKTKVAAIRTLLNNLKQVKPQHLNQKLTEMLALQEAKMQQSQQEKKRRLSDPPPFSKDHKKSIHYEALKNKERHNASLKHNMTTELGLLEGEEGKYRVEGKDNDSDDGERNIMSFPLTPNRSKRYQFVDKSSISAMYLDRELTPLQHTFRMTSKKDQEIQMAAEQEATNRMKEEMEKLERERIEIKRLNDELREQRLQLERERAEIERLRDEGSKSARGRSRDDKDKLEGIENQDDYMSHTVSGMLKKGKMKRTDLDAVRETDEEIKGKKRALMKDRSQNDLSHRSRNQLLQGKQSQKSIHSELGPPNPHKCHGQSVATRESIYKMKQKGMGSRTSSFGDFNSPGRIQQRTPDRSQGGGSPFKRNNLNDNASNKKEAAYVKKTGTKVYYSDKSESSIEDLMDETPSNYNIPNGRLDGKSMGFRFGKNIINKGNSPEKIDIFKEQQNRLNAISSEGGSPKKQPKIKKKFRGDPESGDDQSNNQNASSIFNMEGSIAGIEDNQAIPQNLRGSKNKLKLDANLNRIQNNISNLSLGESQFYTNNQTNEYVTLMDQDIKRNNGSNTSSAMGTLITGNSKLLKGRDKSGKTQSNFKQSQIDQKVFSQERIKALEVAYLTKLVPNKSPQRSTQNLFNSGNNTVTNQRMSVQTRQSNFTPDITSKVAGQQIMQAPQINNFQQ